MDQLRFEGKTVMSVSLKIPGAGIVPFVVDDEVADKLGSLALNIGDRITWQLTGAVQSISHAEPMDKNGVGKAPLSRVHDVRSMPATFELIEVIRPDDFALAQTLAPHGAAS
jgi:hypothetical protein